MEARPFTRSLTASADTQAMPMPTLLPPPPPPALGSAWLEQPQATKRRSNSILLCIWMSVEAPFQRCQ